MDRVTRPRRKYLAMSAREYCTGTNLVKIKNIFECAIDDEP